MAITKQPDFKFVPQVANHNISAYFRRELIWGQLALRIMSSFQEMQGLTATFPYYDKIGDAQDLTEDTALDIDSLGDDKFSVTVKEAGKAVGRTDTAKKAHGENPSRWETQAHAQIARVLAEKVDADLLTEISKSAASTSVRGDVANITLATAFGADKGKDDAKFTANYCTIRKISSDMTAAFGDKRFKELAAVVIHSKVYNQIEIDGGAGFLKADANHPLFNKYGFVGSNPMFFGVPFFVNDNVAKGNKVTVTDSASATQKYQTYKNHYFKKDAFGLLVKQPPMVEYARNTLERKDVITCCMWYAAVHLNQRISPDDVRHSVATYLTDEETT